MIRVKSNYLGKVKEEMLRTFEAGCTSALLALRILEIDSIDEFATSVALITSGIRT